MNVQQFLLLLLARWKLILSTLVTVVATTLVVSLVIPKQYTATTAVVVDARTQDSVVGMMLPVSSSYMATQQDIITSDRVARRVVRIMGFDKNPDLVQKWRDATEGRGSVEGYYADLLQNGLEVKPSRESNVINISFRGADPKFAAAVANTVAQAYIETNLELKVEPAKQFAVWFDERTKVLREGLERAQARLSAYQQEKGIVSIDERLDMENARLNELSSQLTAIEAQKTDSRSRQAQAVSQTDTAPDVINSPIVQTLRADVARMESKLQELAAQFGRNHPQYQRQEAEIAALRQKLADEMKKIASSLGTATQVTTQRESEIRASLDAQKKKVLELKNQRDEVSVLVRDVDSAQKAYDLVSNRLNQTSLESQSQQTNVAVLSPALEPLTHSRPRIMLNVILAFIMGSLLGVGAALVLELSNRRVRSADDLSETLDLLVLAVLQPSKSLAPKGLAALWRRFRPAT